MEIRALLSAMWRNRTGPILVAAQVAITLAVVVNVGYVVQLRLKNVAEPTGLRCAEYLLGHESVLHAGLQPCGHGSS